MPRLRPIPPAESFRFSHRARTSSRRRSRASATAPPPARTPGAARGSQRSESLRLSWHAVRVFTPLALTCILVCVARPLSGQNLRYGMNTRVLTPAMADKMAELGAGVVRLAFGWDVIEPNCKGCYSWERTDGWRDEARRTRRTIFASLAYAPAWANGGRHYSYPPLNYQDWYDFVFATVSRYRDDIFLWGVWNEPNLDVYLQGSDLRVYRTLTVMAHAAIRAANPRAVILGPDVSWHGVKDGWFPAAMNDFGDLFDIVTVHWYPDGP